VPAVSGVSAIAATWFSDMSAALAAGLITSGVDFVLDAAWSAWQDGLYKTFAAEKEAGYKYFMHEHCGDGVPPALMSRSLVTDEPDPTTDRLIVCVNGGAEYVAFDPWAWKALYFFIDDLTKDKEGDTLAGYQALCRISLIPNAPPEPGKETGSGRSELLEYKTRNGTVEMNRRTNPDGTTTVQVTATGIPSADGTSTTRDFDIPEGYSEPADE
jgi:hypothetical protein